MYSGQVEMKVKAMKGYPSQILNPPSLPISTPMDCEQVLRKILDAVRCREELGLSNNAEMIISVINRGWCPEQRQVMEAEGEN